MQLICAGSSPVDDTLPSTSNTQQADPLEDLLENARQHSQTTAPDTSTSAANSPTSLLRRTSARHTNLRKLMEAGKYNQRRAPAMLDVKESGRSIEDVMEEVSKCVYSTLSQVDVN